MQNTPTPNCHISLSTQTPPTASEPSLFSQIRTKLAAVLMVLLAVLTALPAQAEVTFTYYHTDHLGNVVATTDEAGNVTRLTEYHDYGSRQNHAATDPVEADDRPGYTGKFYDKYTNTVYLGGRFYDPDLGRFLTPDPVKFNEQNLMMFNRYAYGNNSPYMYVDPDGANAVTAFGGLLYESAQFVSGHGFNGRNVLGALADGYNGEGSGLARAAIDDALTFFPLGAVAGAAVKFGRMVKAAKVTKTAASFGQLRTTVTSAQKAYKGSTVVGHALSKHAGRNPDIWGKMAGSMKTWNDQAMKHFNDIARGPGQFQKVTDNGISFMEKRLSDGRGMRLNMDSTFKGFID